MRARIWRWGRQGSVAAGRVRVSGVGTEWRWKGECDGDDGGGVREGGEMWDGWLRNGVKVDERVCQRENATELGWLWEHNGDGGGGRL